MRGLEAEREWKTPSDMVERPAGVVSWREGGCAGGGRRTDVAEADEEDGDGFGGCRWGIGGGRVAFCHCVRGEVECGVVWWASLC